MMKLPVERHGIKAVRQNGQDKTYSWRPMFPGKQTPTISQWPHLNLTNYFEGGTTHGRGIVTSVTSGSLGLVKYVPPD